MICLLIHIIIVKTSLPLKFGYFDTSFKGGRFSLKTALKASPLNGDMAFCLGECDRKTALCWLSMAFCLGGCERKIALCWLSMSYLSRNAQNTNITKQLFRYCNAMDV